MLYGSSFCLCLVGITGVFFAGIVWLNIKCFINVLKFGEMARNCWFKL